MNAQRLLRLADYLEKEVGPEQFDIHHWKCGSTACALGHAADIPEFKRAGFTCAGRPCFEGFGHFEAAEKFFDISEHDAMQLFAESRYVNDYRTTKEEVVARIREFVGVAPAVPAFEMPLIRPVAIGEKEESCRPNRLV